MAAAVVRRAFVNVHAAVHVVSDPAAAESLVTGAVSAAGKVFAQRERVTPAVVNGAFVFVGATVDADAVAVETRVAGAITRTDGVGASGVGMAAAVIRLTFVDVRAAGNADGDSLEAVAAGADAKPGNV